MLAHGIVVVFVDASALLLLSAILPGLTVDGPWAAVGTAILIGALNALVWPVLARFTVRLSVLTLGLFGLLLNGLMVALAMLAMPWLQFDGAHGGPDRDLHPGRADLAHLCPAGDRRRQHLVPERGRASTPAARAAASKTDEPGIVFLEIDGLAYDVLRRALANGSAPTLATWIRDRRLRTRMLADRLVLADRRLSGRHPSRQQPRHAGLPLVGEGFRLARS